MKAKTRKLLALLLTAILLSGSISGCAILNAEEPDYPYDPNNPEYDLSGGIDANIPRNGELAISFVPDDPLNPYTNTSRDNLAVSGLLYEGLFALGENFSSVPVLAQTITTLDGRNFMIEIQSGITFHNGAPLTVTDVIYSLNRARGSALYGSRLEIITGYSRIYDEDGTPSPYDLELTIDRVHGNLPVLLTFPIIQQGTGYARVPPGTGPFQHPDDEGRPRLERFPAHPRNAELTLNTIYLAEINTIEQMAAYFNSGLLDIVFLDPTTMAEPRLAGTREVRFFEASMIDYLGFNLHRPETARLEVRQAISRAIDRDYITENIMRGNAVSSTLPLHPALPFYDTILAQQHAYDLEAAREILGSPIGEDDDRSHMWAPFPSDDDEPDEPEEETETDVGRDDLGAPSDEDEDDEETPAPRLMLLVAAGNTMRTEVATFIAANISALGYQVVVVDLPYNEFMQALEAGDFDLFYGQVRLQPDFDLTPILLGDLAFGGLDRAANGQAIDDFLASSQSNRGEMATALGMSIFAQMPIATIGFRSQAVATQRGVVAGMNPTQENIYHNVWDWLLDL